MFHRKHISLSLLITNILLSCIITQSLSQDTNTVKYFPLKVGNIWVYQITATGSFCYRIQKRRIKVINTIILNSKKYFLFKDTTILISGDGWCGGNGSFLFDTLRIDSTNGNIYKYSYQGCTFLNHEITLDSLKAKLKDKIFISCGSDTNYKCTDTSSQVIFGQSRQVKAFNAVYFEGAQHRKYSKGFGQSSYGYSSIPSFNNATLIGCVLDGILYGDTSFITGINQINSETPKSFLLFQNYPNPFNPKSNIKFQIAKLGEVKIVIYDILGREITFLVNQQLQPGTYEVEWDGSNYSSGIYYYSLVTTEFVETKKMVLIK